MNTYNTYNIYNTYTYTYNIYNTPGTTNPLAAWCSPRYILWCKVAMTQADRRRLLQVRLQKIDLFPSLLDLN